MKIHSNPLCRCIPLDMCLCVDRYVDRYVQRLVSIPNTTTDFDSSTTMPYVSFNTLLYSKEVRT